MNFDEIKGKAQNAFGKLEDTVGEAIGSRDLANAGKEDRVKGAATETWGNVKDTASSLGSTAQTRENVEVGHTHAAGEGLRDRLVNGAEQFRDRVNEKLDHVQENQRIERDTVRRD